MFKTKIITIIVLLGFSLITLNSCSKTDARKVSPNPKDRVKKNLEEGKGFRLDDALRGGKKKVEISYLQVQTSFGEPL